MTQKQIVKIYANKMPFYLNTVVIFIKYVKLTVLLLLNSYIQNHTHIHSFYIQSCIQRD